MEGSLWHRQWLQLFMIQKRALTLNETEKKILILNETWKKVLTLKNDKKESSDP